MTNQSGSTRRNAMQGNSLSCAMTTYGTGSHRPQDLTAFATLQKATESA
ncbi:MAG TPA: hypothetical protein VFC43_02860 [Methanoregula sp.]|nr:hypothetical protein [Methanoregula sp.]